MKITIVGPGALGCLLAAFLTKSKNKENEIWLLDKDSQRSSKISKNGLTVDNFTSTALKVDVKITADIQDINETDLMVLCVKSYDTKSAIEKVKSLIGENTSVLTLQNGIGNVEIIGEVIGPDKVIAGITNLGSTWIDTGHVRFAGKGETIIGKIDGKTSVQMRSIREIFNRAGIETRISQDIKGLIWSKLIINTGINALTAILRLNNGNLVNYESSKKILREAVTEAVKIAKRKRIKLLYDDPLAKVEAVCEATKNNVSSMLQDVLRQKRTEIDFINGVIVRFGQELSIPVPINSALVDLIKTIESSYEFILK